MSDIDVIEVYPVELTSTNSTRPEKFDGYNYSHLKEGMENYDYF
jgi:hypothetical protein